MKRYACFLTVFVFVFFTAFACFAQKLEDVATLPSSFRPLTNEEILTFKDKPFKEKLGFMTTYYLENKMSYNATDEAVLNEMVKLDPQLAITVLKANSNFQKGMKTFKEYYKEIVANLNVEIAEKYPNQPEQLIDPNDISTLKNITNLASVGGISFNLIDAWSDNRSFSETKKEDFGQVTLYSCARKKGSKDILMGLRVRMNPNYTLLYQKEGEPVLPVVADYSQSENMTAQQVLMPATDSFKTGAQKSSGYVQGTLFPFTASVIDDKLPAKLNATFSFTVCNRSECNVKTTPVLVQNFDSKTQVETKICYEIMNRKMKIPELDNLKTSVKKTVLQQTEEGTFLFVLIKNSFLNFKTPVLKIDNAVGLHFDEPSFNLRDGQILFRAKLLNPEALKLPVDLRLTLKIFDRASVKNVEISKIQQKGQLFAPTFWAYMSTFFSGMKFLLITPLLTVLMLFVFQIGLAKNTSELKTKNFFKGILYAGLGVVALASGVLKINGFTWGNQFTNPYLNCVFILIFASVPFAYFLILEKAEQHEKNMPKAMQLAGSAVCLLSSVLLFITPQFQTFFDVYTVVQTQKTLGVFLFLCGIAAPFFAVYGVRRKILPKPVTLSARGKLAFCAGDVLQSILFLLIIGIQTHLESFVLLVILSAGGVVVLINKQIKERFKILAPICILFAGLFFLPFKSVPTTYPEFSADNLSRALEEEKTVYVNVSTPACLLCRYNLLEFSIIRKNLANVKEKIVIMQTNLENKKIKALLQDAESYALPANILFSPKYKEGYFLPEKLSRENILIGLNHVLEEVN